ncbi:ATP-binding protein [Streptomyces sp. NPDC052236]|uniref:ATP-binding protein n=1 Tax=Streptomyces sp. NPDC052236 TaxID=3365686 RepID=UPI0037D0F16F
MVISPVRQHHMVLPEISPDSMEPVREIVRILLRMWRKSDLSFVAELGVTELLTNVWKHAPGACELLVRDTPDGVMVGVTDFDDALPAVKEPADDAECGRGLFLLAELTEELHTQPLLTGKQVWFRLSQTPADGEEGAEPC